MINAEELVIEMSEGEEQKCFKLGTVIDLFENDTAKIQFDGEEEPSEKQYAYLDMYIPVVGDRVLLGALGGTYVILGKVNYNVPPSVEEEIDRYLFDLKQVIMKHGLNVTGDTTIEGNLNITGKTTTSQLELQGSLIMGGDIEAGNVKGENITATSLMKVGRTEIIDNRIKTGYADVTTLDVGTLAHDGTTLGFFGATLKTKQTVSRINVNTTLTLEVLRDKINSLLSALDYYGLIND